MKKVNWTVIALMMAAFVMLFGVTACNEVDNPVYDTGETNVEVERKVTVNGLRYFLFPETQEAVVDNGNTWSGELEIPSEINYGGKSYTVKGMCRMAFCDCKELTKVRIPKTIAYIIDNILSVDHNMVASVSSDCMNPFIRCTALESIEVDEANPNMKSIGGVLYSKDGTGLYCYPAGNKKESYIVPEGVTMIGIDAFAYNESIVSIEMPATVKKLYGGVFLGCKKLERVNLPEKMTSLEAYMFRGCSSLKSIEIPEGVKYLGEQVFFGCSSLKTIILPSTVTFVGSISFSHCMLDALVINGHLDSQSLNPGLFSGLNESAKVYAPALEIELGRYDDLFAGAVLPLEEYYTEEGWTPNYHYLDYSGVMNDPIDPSITEPVRELVYTWNEAEEIDGKTYFIVYNTFFFSNRKLTYTIHLRKEGRRILVRFEEYKQFMRNSRGRYISKEENSQCQYIITPDGEMVLYDFDMQVGDKFCPFEGMEDVYVIGKETISMKDAGCKSDKDNLSCLVLSNGVRIIEDIGFAYISPYIPSSTADFFDYLNVADGVAMGWKLGSIK